MKYISTNRLPETWYVLLTEDNREELSKVHKELTKNCSGYDYNSHGSYYGMCHGSSSCISFLRDFDCELTLHKLKSLIGGYQLDYIIF